MGSGRCSAADDDEVEDEGGEVGAMLVFTRSITSSDP